MAKNEITLTESGLKVIIKEAIDKALQEIKGRTLAKVSNSAINSVDNIERGINRTFYGTRRGIKMIDHNDNIRKADNLNPRAIQSFLSPYKSTTFLFWAYRREGNPIHLLFKVDNIKKIRQ